MKNHFKIFISTLLIVSPFFSLGEIAYAQSSGQNQTDISACVSEAIKKNIAVNAGTAAAQAAAEAAGATAASGSLGVATTVSVPVVDAVSNITLGTISGLQNAHSSFQDIFKMDLDSAAYSLAQCTLTQLTDNTIKWIQGGFNGSPSYAVDVRGLFEDIAKGVAEDFSNQLRGLALCDFTPNFINDFPNAVAIQPKKKTPPKIQCPFPAQNVQASQFYKQYGPIAWNYMESALSDGGNRFGVSVVTSEELAYRQEQAKATNDQKLSWGNGFTDMVESYTSENCKYPANVYEMMHKDPPADWDGIALSQESISFYQNKYCPTTTPGDMLSKALFKASSATADRIGFADNMNKLIGALIGELTKEATQNIFKAANNATPASGPSHNEATITGSTITGAGSSATIGYVQSNGADVGANIAVLHGYVNTPQSPGSVWFEWSTSSNLVPLVITEKISRTGADPATYSSVLSGLATSTTYYFRAVGISSTMVDPTYGGTQSFRTNAK